MESTWWQVLLFAIVAALVSGAILLMLEYRSPFFAQFLERLRGKRDDESRVSSHSISMSRSSGAPVTSGRDSNARDVAGRDIVKNYYLPGSPPRQDGASANLHSDAVPTSSRSYQIALDMDRLVRGFEEAYEPILALTCDDIRKPYSVASDILLKLRGLAHDAKMTLNNGDEVEKTVLELQGVVDQDYRRLVVNLGLQGELSKYPISPYSANPADEARVRFIKEMWDSRDSAREQIHLLVEELYQLLQKHTRETR